MAEDWVSILSRSKILPILHSGQTASGAKPYSYPINNGNSFPGGKASKD
jgi:hypothetical protein